MKLLINPDIKSHIGIKVLNSNSTGEWLPDGSENRSVAEVATDSRIKCLELIKCLQPQIVFLYLR